MAGEIEARMTERAAAGSVTPSEQHFLPLCYSRLSRPECFVMITSVTNNVCSLVARDFIVRPEESSVGRGYTQYRFPETGREEWVLFSTFIHYRFADDSKLRILQNAAWCTNCNRFVLAEEIPSIESLENELYKTKVGDEETLRIWQFVSNGQPVSTRISELEKRINWRFVRVNPPRCLECGGFRIIDLPGGSEFRHPNTGELVMEVSSGWTDVGPWCADFTPEGDRFDEPSGERDLPRIPVFKS